VNEGNEDEWSVEAALGYMTFRDQADAVGDQYDIRGNTVGAFLGAGYHFKITKGVYFGPKVSLLVGSVGKVEIDGPGSVEERDLENPESLSRFDVSLGLRFKL
jgi:outer membrane autotransporter protein